MRRGKGRGRRLLALWLCLVMLVVRVPALSFAEEAYSGYLDGWSVECVWADLNPDYVWNASGDEERQPKLMFTYRLEQAGRDYPAGSLSVTIPGIGSAVRGQVKKASKIAADKDGAEWSYVWDSRQDVYTFTNRFDVKAGQSLSGGFEMLWTMKARDCTDGYTQKKSPVFAVDGAGAITMEPLEYRFGSMRDRYRMSWNRSRLTGAQAETADPDYVWYQYGTRFDVDRLARGLYRSEYFVSVELPEGADYGDVKVILDGRDCELASDGSGAWGFLSFRERGGDLSTDIAAGTNQFRIGFRREALDGQQVSLHGHLNRLYQDETDWTVQAGENECVDVEDTFTVEGYGFQYTGYVYQVSKYSEGYENIHNHSAPKDYTDRLNAVSLYSGQVVKFTLSGQANRSYGEAAAAGVRYGDNETGEDIDRSAVCGELASPSDLVSSVELAGSSDLVSSVELASSSDVADLPEVEEVSGEADGSELASPSDMEILSEDELVLETDGAGRNGIGENMMYSLILGDDKLAVCQNNGEIRALEDEEYDVESVTVPSDGRDYDYQVYGAGTQDTDFSAYELIGTGSTGAEQTFHLDEGCKAVYVRANGITGSCQLHVNVGIRFHLDWESEQKKPVEERVDHEERVINFGYLRSMYETADQGEQKDNVVGADSYVEAYGRELAERDWNTYGEYQQRGYSHVWLRSPVTEVKAGTLLQDFVLAGRDRFETRISSAGRIRADEQGPLERFSLYAVLPDGLRTDPDRDEIEIGGSGFFLTGEGADGLQDYAAVRMEKWNGRDVIAADFDFAGAPLDISQLTSVYMIIPASLIYVDYLTYGNRYEVTTFLLPQDGGLDRISGEAVTADEYDIDGDGVLTDRMAYNIAGAVVSDDVSEWRGYSSKYVKSSYSGGYVQDTVAKCFRADGTAEEKAQALYSYRLDLGLGASSAGNIVLYDRIEQGATIALNEEEPDAVTVIPSGWQGEFQQVDTGFAEKLGMIPTVFYSEDANQELSLDAQGWSTTVPADPASVRAVAVSLDTSGMEHGVMKAGQMVYVVVWMRAPEIAAVEQVPSGNVVMDNVASDNGTAVGQQAVNQYLVTFDAYDGGTGVERSISLLSSETRVKLLDTVGQIVLQKEDGDRLLGTDPDGTPHYAPLTGAVFQVYDVDGNPLFGTEGRAVNGLGNITVSKVPYGTYYYEERKAPPGYRRIAGRQKFQIDGVKEVLPVQNYRIPGEVILTKTDADDENHRPLSGAEFELYRADGRKVFTDEAFAYSDRGTKGVFVTDDAGQIHITNLPWDSYRFVERKTPKGYTGGEAPIEFRVGKALYNPETERIVASVFAENRQLAADVLVRKTDAESGEPLQNACYDLYKQKVHTADGTAEWGKIREALKTNAAGELTVTGLKFGTYQLRETLAPRGYQISEEYPEFTLDAAGTGTVPVIRHVNRRKTGSVQLKKTSEDGLPLSGAVYTLYRERSDIPVAENLVTGEDGSTQTVTGLVWGDYCFVETKAPKGYVMDETPIRFMVDAGQVDIPQQVRAVNNRIRGSVMLVKMDEDTRSIRLPGAEFCLYGNDGSLIRSGLITGADGSVRVDGLDWGSYYFEEKKAPNGYGISRDKVRFSVNGDNCTVEQTVFSYDPFEQVQIRINKKINEQYEAFGRPTFIYEISGRDVSQREHRWIRTITLDGVNSGETVLGGIPAGIYRVTELEGSRYSHCGVTPVSQVTELVGIGSAVPEAGRYYPEAEGAVVDLTAAKEAEITFHNEMSQYEKLSHMTGSVNLIAARKKMTGLTVTYSGPAVIESDTEDTYAFRAGDLEATVSYDDGSSAVVPFGRLELDPASVTGDFNTSGAGYTVHVSYTEGGLTCRDSFGVEIRLQPPAKPPRVIYDANGGYFGEDPNLVINQVLYQTGVIQVPPQLVRKIAKSKNVSEDGSSFQGEYGNSMNEIQVVTIPGADRLHVKITCQTESINYDWVCIYPPDMTPLVTNHTGSISGKLGGKVKTTNEYDVEGDTVKFYLHSDRTSSNYYGYYAEVTYEIPAYEKPGNVVLSGSYLEPKYPSGDKTVEFAGWYTDAACSAGQEFDPESAELGEETRVYAKWKILVNEKNS
ncbi:MAG: SpaA isopeptide-forming pilin-related protein [Eubacteriales bacterium]|nr:SpaA isopeptide-forming pilin-related protein [Eubacteriales bacterium]